jgi:hypothetical protein
MSKFSKVVRIKPQFSTISHAGQTFKEEHEGTGLVEVSNEHADGLVSAGVADHYAATMDEALEKLTAGAKVEDPAADAQKTAEAAAAAARAAQQKKGNGGKL